MSWVKAWGGEAHVRAAPYMGALVATRRNLILKEFYESEVASALREF